MQRAPSQRFVRLCMTARRGQSMKKRRTVRDLIAVAALTVSITVAPDSAWSQTQLLPTGEFCGNSQPTTGSICSASTSVCGYPAAKEICVQVCNKQTAHMCTTGEIALNAQNSTLPPPNTNSWVSSGEGSDVFPPANNDCRGWTSSGTDRGPVFYATAPGHAPSQPNTSQCFEALPIACCH